MTLLNPSVDIASRQAIATADGLIGGTLCTPVESAAEALIVCVHGSGCNGRYFDLAGNSLADQAVACDMAVLLLDRPGHGVSVPPPSGSGSAILQGAIALGDLVRAVHAERPDVASLPLLLVGHSFGGAVALTFAANASDLTVSAICVSGIGDRPNGDYAAAERLQTSARGATPAPYWLFGPGSSYDWRGITALRASADSWRAEEVAEITGVWPRNWADTVRAIACPVHVRLAEHERIWEATPTAIERIAGSFIRSPQVDAAIALGGGHLYEVHLRGPELIDAQISFLRRVIHSRGMS